MVDLKSPDRRKSALPPRRPSIAKWTKAFLAELAATSNVSASARKAGISTTTAYDSRRSDPEFNRKWQSALCEGYEHLEMEMLHRLRTGEIKQPPSAKRGTRSFDNATAFRLLVAHRDSAARQKAIRADEDADAIIVTIDAKLAIMRQRWLAARSNDDTQ